MSEPLASTGETFATDSLGGAPAEYLTPEDRPTLDEARAWCHQLASSHYENFHVATFFLPRIMRPHFEGLYAFCRVSDDLGDEVGDTATALRLLNTWGGMLDQCYDAPAQSRHPVFVALHETIAACDLPRGLFHDLLRAFKQDQVRTRYDTWDEAVEYSRYSANPVGRLVLMVCGYRDEARALLSDNICTALQLANFWQDVRVDFLKGRVYLPQDDMRRFGVSDETIAHGVATPEFRALLRHEVDFARTLFAQGLPLIGRVNRDLALDLDLFSRGGLEILRAIERRDYDVLSARPAISKLTKLSLAVRALAGKALPFLRLGPRSTGKVA
jgi:squalene synthase HpnC